MRQPRKNSAVLADRLAILLCVAKQRHGGSWIPWFQEGTYDDEGSLGDEIRQWPEYKEALDVVRLFMRRNNERTIAHTVNTEAPEEARLQSSSG